MGEVYISPLGAILEQIQSRFPLVPVTIPEPNPTLKTLLKLWKREDDGLGSRLVLHVEQQSDAIAERDAVVKENVQLKEQVQMLGRRLDDRQAALAERIRLIDAEKMALEQTIATLQEKLGKKSEEEVESKKKSRQRFAPFPSPHRGPFDPMAGEKPPEGELSDLSETDDDCVIFVYI